MKKPNVSLIVKISGMVFIAFALILGNEIRLGIDRYVKNTLETDAQATVRLLDSFAKDYSDLTIYDSYPLTSDEFTEIYNDALRGDSSLIKSLVTPKGKIIDISRETLEETILCIVINDFQGAKNWPAYFYLNNMGDKNIHILEDYFNHCPSSVRNVTLSVHFPKDTDFTDNEFHNAEISKIMIEDETIVENKVSGRTVDIQGQLSFYSSQYVEAFFGNNAQLIYYGDSARAITDNIEAIVIDYNDALQGIQYQLSKNFKKFTKVDSVFSSTNYADYYLLKPYKYNGKYYSSVMVKIVDWTYLNKLYYDFRYENLTDEEKMDKALQGYLIVTKEYDQLISTSMKQFIIDNYTTYLLAFLLIALICLILAYILVKPIHRLETVSKHIARKEFDYPINLTRHDELGNLARSIDKMSKELEKTINHLYLQVEKVKSLEMIRKDFVANFTHEIKTPLGIINGFSELVELEQDETKRNEYIQIIQNETKKINELVLAMLEYSKLESENITLDLEDVDLLEVVDESIDAMFYLFQKKNIQLKTSLESVVVNVDKFKIEMVINNFISNALRYTSEGKTIEIKLDQHTFSIENEGAYIPKEDMDKIWLTFHKVDKARSEEGTGIGLAICRAALDLHHFDYGVKNTETGVLFYFHFNPSEN